MKKWGIFGLVLFMFSALEASAQKKMPAYPAFVYGHIVWEDESTSVSLRELVKGYQDRQIPVSGVIIDSPWETAYNTFEFDLKRFPDYKKLISELKGQDLALIMWATCAINTDDPDYNLALQKGYFAPGLEKFKWWKGTGGLIDYQNPEAMKFWHRRMDKALDLGIDGWKVDGVDATIALKSLKKRNQYAADYYADFFHYSREHTGRPMVIMARGIEQFNEHTLSLPSWVNPFRAGLDLKYAAVEDSFMTWMGDQDPTWGGMRDAFIDFRLSADAGYLVPGFDIAGYRDGKPDKELFLRWAQWGAFAPFMENGGVAEHRPWKFGEDAVAIYRRLAVWHEELGWYFYSLSEQNFLAGKSLVEMNGKSYLLGDAVSVTPIFSAGGKAAFKLPDGDWRYWYNLSQGVRGGSAVSRQFPLSEFPVYVREGSLVPLWVKSAFGGHKLNPAFASQDTFWLLPGQGQGSRTLIFPEGGRGKVSWKRGAKGIEVVAEGLRREVVLLVEGIDNDPGDIVKTDKELEKSTLGKIAFFIKTIATGGKYLDKKNCEEITPGPGAEYCLKKDQLYAELIPENGRAEIKISF